jgi:hypothetical protein
MAKTETVTATCKNCRKKSEFDKPADHNYDLRWECPHCEMVNLLEGSEPHPAAGPVSIAKLDAAGGSES